MNKKSNKFLLEASITFKIIIIISITFITKLFFSCTPSPPIEIHYNSIIVSGINNSDKFVGITNVDTMYSSAIALNLTLFDSTNRYHASNNKIVSKSFSITPAMAFSISKSFIPVNKVVYIKTTTMFDIDEDVKAGDDISNLIVYDTGDNFLYQDMTHAISTMNRTQASASSSVLLALKKSIKNTKAQFNIQVTLDNGNKLSYTTNLFTIIIP